MNAFSLSAEAKDTGGACAILEDFRRKREMVEELEEVEGGEEEDEEGEGEEDEEDDVASVTTWARVANFMETADRVESREGRAMDDRVSWWG